MTNDERPSTNGEPLVRVVELTKHFPIRQGLLVQRVTGQVQAVDGLSFEIARGETLGLVGESGCGKSTAGRTLLGLYPATSGDSFIAGHHVQTATGDDYQAIRRQAQMIFQDPFASLNPRWTVSSIIGEPLRVHDLITGDAARTERVQELMALVGLDSRFVNRFPHEFSGGQRQRIGIARSLASDPLFLVCDEPISALDVSIQAQVVNLLEELQDRLGLTYLFIAHDLSMVRHICDRVLVMYLGVMVELAAKDDLSMVRHICDRVLVMYLGVMVELAAKDDLYEEPLHPYTQALLSAVPVPDPKLARRRRRIVLEGDVPSPINPPSGCRFHTRCPIAQPHCATHVPVWREIRAGHWVACHEVEPKFRP